MGWGVPARDAWTAGACLGAFGCRGALVAGEGGWVSSGFNNPGRHMKKSINQYCIRYIAIQAVHCTSTICVIFANVDVGSYVRDIPPARTYSPSGPQLPISQIWISSTVQAPRSTFTGARRVCPAAACATLANVGIRGVLTLSLCLIDWNAGDASTAAYENGTLSLRWGLRYVVLSTVQWSYVQNLLDFDQSERNLLYLERSSFVHDKTSPHKLSVNKICVHVSEYFHAGHARGNRILHTLCNLTLSPSRSAAPSCGPAHITCARSTSPCSGGMILTQRSPTRSLPSPPPCASVARVCLLANNSRMRGRSSFRRACASARVCPPESCGPAASDMTPSVRCSRRAGMTMDSSSPGIAGLLWRSARVNADMRLRRSA